MSNLKVIDVSEHQGVINWELVKGNVDGVILRCGYGDNIASQDDVQWQRNIQECERLGIPRGVYLYSYADSDAHAQSELAHLLRLLAGHAFQLPIYLDCEQAGTEWYASKACQIVCEGLKAAGYTPGVYANLNWWNNYLTGVTAYTRWVAQYNSQCDYAGSYDIWQYSSNGTVPGIYGRVDMNWCYKEFDQLGGGGSSTPNPPPGLKELGPVDFVYQAFTDRWWPAVRNRLDWAGKGDNYPIRYLAVCVSKGSIRGRVYTRKSGWLTYLTFTNSYNLNDLANGVLGDGSEILGIELYYYTPAGYMYKVVNYRVSVRNNSGFYPAQVDNIKQPGYDGYAGDLVNDVDKFQGWVA